MDADVELAKLRNELLIELNKKPCKLKEDNTISTDNQSPPEKDDDDDDELQRLRLEALNAKRRTSNTHTQKNMPGRFRYDRESETDEDDDDEDDMDENWNITSKNNLKIFRKNDIEEEDIESNEPEQNLNSVNLSAQYPYSVNGYSYEPTPVQSNNELNNDDDYNDNTNQVNAFKNKYEAYRFECSKLMANDAYEPDSVPDTLYNQPNNNISFTKMLRDQALRQQSTDQNADANYDQETSTFSHDGIEYVYESITRPIKIDNQFRNNVNMNNRLNTNGNRYYPKMRPNRFHYQERRPNGVQNPNYTKFNSNHDRNRSGARIDHTDKESDRSATVNDNLDDEDDDEDDLKHKKLKSIVVAKNINQNFPKETVQNVRHSPYSSSSKSRVRKQSNSSSNSSR